MASRTFYSPLICSTAAAHSLDPRLVEAVVIQESAGTADAFRFEPKFYARYLVRLPAYAGMNPRRISSSYGLMQIMYVVAVELGFRGEPEELFIPAINLIWGCTKLAQLMTWAKGDLLSVAAAYNGGRADNEPGHQPMLRNEKYARSVLAIMKGLPA